MDTPVGVDQQKLTFIGSEQVLVVVWGTYLVREAIETDGEGESQKNTLGARFDELIDMAPSIPIKKNNINNCYYYYYYSYNYYLLL